MVALLFFLSCILLNAWVAEGSLISQSILQQCTTGSSSEPKGKGKTNCKSKFVVSMTLRGGQVGSETMTY